MSDQPPIYKEFTKTKEMGLAWLFRAALMTAIGASAFIGRQAWTKLDDVGDRVLKLDVFVQKVDDLNSFRDSQIKALQDTQADHETRLRFLEKK